MGVVRGGVVMGVVKGEVLRRVLVNLWERGVCEEIW